MSHARALVLAVAVLLASCGAQPRREAPQPPVSVPAAIAPRGITVAAVGDIMMGTDFPQNTLPDDDGVGFLASVAPILSAADVAFGNLEGVLMDGGEAVKQCKRARKRKTESAEAVVAPKAPSPPSPPSPPAPPPLPAPPPAAVPAPPTSGPEAPRPDDVPNATAPVSTANESSEPPTVPVEESGAIGSTTDSTTTPAAVPAPPATGVGATATPTPLIPGSCFVFRTPTRYANYLREAGFDVASLANNHAQDFGDAGRDSSMRALDAAGILHSGRDGDVAEWNTQGRRFALAAFAPNVGSHQLNDLARAQDIVRKLAARNDIVIVSFHGGGEGEGASKLPFAHEIYQGEDRGDVVEFAHTVIDAGADLVLGHGPHVLRAMELYRDRLIAYSLGNFATYYGISVNGIRGTAAVVVARLADDGRFLDARIESTVQIRPAGPQPDPERRAVTQIRDLTNEAFPEGHLEIADDGKVTPRP